MSVSICNDEDNLMLNGKDKNCILHFKTLKFNQINNVEGMGGKNDFQNSN